MRNVRRVRNQKQPRVLSQALLILLFFVCTAMYQNRTFTQVLDHLSAGKSRLAILGTRQGIHRGDKPRHTRSSSSSVLFNPFRDIRLSPPPIHNSKDLPSYQRHYSSYQCVSAVGSNDQPHGVRFLSRTCKFDNLYYSPQDATFHYYPSPSEVSLYRNNQTATLILQEEMTISLGHVFQKDSKSINTVPPYTKWRPIIHVHDSPPISFAKLASPDNPLFLLYHPFYSFNFGHFIWDDLLGLFSMMDIFSLKDDEITHIPLMVEFPGQDSYYRCQAQLKGINMNGRWDQCAKMYQKMFPFLLRSETHSTGDILRTNTWLKGMDDVGYWSNARSSGDKAADNWNTMLPNTSHVLIPTALAGMGRLGQMSCTADCAIGRASQLASFRQFLLRNIFWLDYEQGMPERDPIGYITFSLPIGSSRPTAVTFFENIIPIAQHMFGNEKIQVVDFSNMTVREQALLAMDTAVLFSYHGGGSATSIFLPKDASILLYSTVGRCTDKTDRGYVWCDRGRNHFDSVFYTSDSYIRTTWVNPEDRYNSAKVKTLLEIEYEKTMRAWGREPYV
jgi:hypothetical protein